MLCFYCFAVLPENAEECPHCGQPTFVITPMGRRPHSRRLDGCLRSERMPQAVRAMPRGVSLPPKVDLRPECSAVEDQGLIGSCAANAAVGAFEHLLRKQGKGSIELSRLFVYYNGRRMGGRVNQDHGMTISEAMASLVAYGAPPEDQWPYDADLWAKEPPKPLYDAAWNNRAQEFARVDPGDGVRGALARGFPVAFGLFMPKICYHEAATSGFMRLPTVEEAKAAFGHAMLAVGYDLAKQEYLVRNCWGPNWADGGYCRTPFTVMDQYAAVDEFWIMGHLDQSAVAPRPNVVAATAPNAAAPRDAARADAAPPVAPTADVSSLAAKMREEIRSSLTKDIADAAKDIRERMRPKPPGAR